MSAAEVTYRPAAAGDAPALAHFAAESFTATFGHLYPPEDLAAFLTESYGPAIQAREIADPQAEHLLAWRGEVLVGYVKIGPDTSGHARPGRAALELKRLYVAETVKGAGVAARLMDWAVERARARGVLDMTLSVFTDNHRAKRFYARYGFVDVAPAVFMVGRVADEDRMYRLSLDGR